MKINKTIIITVTVLLLGITLFSLFQIRSRSISDSHDTNRTHILPEVRYHEITRQNISEDIQTYGSVNFYKKVNVTARVEELVKSIHYDIGDRVSPGSTLASLEDEYIQLSLDIALKEVGSKKAGYNLSLSKYETALQSIEKTIKSLENLEIEEKQKQLELENISHVLSNKRELLTYGGVTKEQIRELENNYHITELKYQSILKQKAAAEIGFRDEDIIKAGLKVPASRPKKLEILKELNTKVERAEMEIAQAEWDKTSIQLKSARLNLNETIIRSPIEGIIAMKYLERGEKTEKAKPLFTIMQLDKVYIELPVTETQIGSIKSGQEINLKIDAYPLQKFSGKVDRIYPMIDTKTRTFTVRCVIQNRKNGKDFLLLPGMFVRANIITSTRKDALTIPFSAMSDKENKQIKVYILKPGDKDKDTAIVVEKWVPFTLLSDDHIEIASGIKEGEWIAVSGLDFLKTGMRVKLKNQMTPALVPDEVTLDTKPAGGTHGD